VAVPVVTFPFKVLFVVAFVAPAIVAQPANKTVIRAGRRVANEFKGFMMYLANSSFMSTPGRMFIRISFLSRGLGSQGSCL